jgi:CheY-like chemotaxis protein
MELEPVDICLSDLLKGITEIARIRSQQRGVSFECEIAPDLPAGICADEKRLRQVLLNLLSNAIKYTEAGSVMFRVSSEPFSTDDVRPSVTNIRFEVQDTGVGISPDDLEDIFLPFHRINHTKLKAEGTGLGLSISRKLVRIMGGELNVKSVAGEGTTFWFTLELPEVEGIAAHEAFAASERPSRVVGFKGDKPTILLVDDDGGNRVLLKKILLSLGFDVAEAANGQDAISKAAELCPELIMMDLMMPSMDGIETTRQIRRTPSTEGITVIAVSASPLDMKKQQSLQAGCNDFLAKPVRMDELLKCLQKYLKLEWLYEESFAAGSDMRQTRGSISSLKQYLLRKARMFVPLNNLASFLKRPGF